MRMNDFQRKIKKVDFLNLPRRSWDKVSTYGSICVINSGRKHDSGYSLMYIIGMNGHVPIEIAAACDDIQWVIPERCDYYFRTDMFYPCGVMHFHSNKYIFQVHRSLSTTEIHLIPNEDIKAYKQ